MSRLVTEPALLEQIEESTDQWGSRASEQKRGLSGVRTTEYVKQGLRKRGNGCEGKESRVFSCCNTESFDVVEGSGTIHSHQNNQDSQQVPIQISKAGGGGV